MEKRRPLKSNIIKKWSWSGAAGRPYSVSKSSFERSPVHKVSHPVTHTEGRKVADSFERRAFAGDAPMRVILILAVAAAVACSADAKRKRKFDGDFEFAEEVSRLCAPQWNRCPAFRSILYLSSRFYHRQTIIAQNGRKCDRLTIALSLPTFPARTNANDRILFIACRATSISIPTRWVSAIFDFGNVFSRTISASCFHLF
ncbi:hypothetical protein Zmor_002169 [Zophobas morio]|uniref:Uncharacterized protein n=1 Tax=Zophobas morio TaxID=2755281 RepID=A0AA38J012_9CUCU|nr:hypothetical protein Zmor_002169 [Zophobas morio]